jgi:hypothetical protein
MGSAAASGSRGTVDECNAGCADVHVPVFEVARTGIEQEQARQLAEALDVPTDRMAWGNGVASFVDTENYLAVPTSPVTDPTVLEEHRQRTTNYHPEIALEVMAIDHDALAGREAMPHEDALQALGSALESAGLTPEGATPIAAHTLFKTISTGGERDGYSETTTLLDTHVRYRFTREGYLLVGPGMQVQASFDHGGRVTRLLYSTHHLVNGPSVRILAEEAVRGRFGCLLREQADISLRLVYWVPPLIAALCASSRWRPGVIIPWYAVTITKPTLDPRTQEQRMASSRVHLVPAIADPRYVPTIALSVTAPQRSRVHARATVTGGTPPYTYLWAGSNPDASRHRGPSVTYEPVTRDLRPFISAQSLERREQVCVTVIDANGVRVHAGGSVFATARPVEETHSSVTYGCESPNDPGPSGDGSYAPERIAWQQAMGMAGQGGGSQRFCWLEDCSWPGDYIEPAPPGASEPSPWINGDADYSDWGINTTNIMLYNGDGSPGGFSEMYPGANTYDYNTGSGAALFLPGTGTTLAIGSQGYAVDYSGSWGAPHPNDNLQWLVMYACEILADNEADPAPWLRWGPAFNGLHILLGFETEASDAGVGFMSDFPANILSGVTLPLFGSLFPPQTIVQGWLNAAIANQMGTPAAMGPLRNVTTDNGTIGISNFTDFYWGKGPVGPSIDRSQINGWWYIQGSDAVEEFP